MKPDSANNSSGSDPIEARITAWLLGELDESEAAEVQAAIARDPRLAQIEQRLRRTIDLVREAVTHEDDPADQSPPQRFSEKRRKRLLATLAGRPAYKRLVVLDRWREWAAPLSLAAGVLLMAGLTTLVLSGHNPFKSTYASAIPSGSERDRGLFVMREGKELAPAEQARVTTLDGRGKQLGSVSVDELAKSAEPAIAFGVALEPSRLTKENVEVLSRKPRAGTKVFLPVPQSSPEHASSGTENSKWGYTEAGAAGAQWYMESQIPVEGQPLAFYHFAGRPGPSGVGFGGFGGGGAAGVGGGYAGVAVNRRTAGQTEAGVRLHEETETRRPQTVAAISGAVAEKEAKPVPEAPQALPPPPAMPPASPAPGPPVAAAATRPVPTPKPAAGPIATKTLELYADTAFAKKPASGQSARGERKTSSATRTRALSENAPAQDELAASLEAANGVVLPSTEAPADQGVAARFAKPTSPAQPPTMGDTPTLGLAFRGRNQAAGTEATGGRLAIQPEERFEADLGRRSEARALANESTAQVREADRLYDSYRSSGARGVELDAKGVAALGPAAQPQSATAPAPATRAPTARVGRELAVTDLQASKADQAQLRERLAKFKAEVAQEVPADGVVSAAGEVSAPEQNATVDFAQRDWSGVASESQLQLGQQLSVGVPESRRRLSPQLKPVPAEPKAEAAPGATTVVAGGAYAGKSLERDATRERSRKSRVGIVLPKLSQAQAGEKAERVTEESEILEEVQLFRQKAPRSSAAAPAPKRKALKETAKAKAVDKLAQAAAAEKRLADEEIDTAKAAELPPPPVPQPEVLTRVNPFSTFSLNVSDVSFKLAAASLEKGQMPARHTIRSEEFINAFDYRDPAPSAGQPIAFHWERARYPFAHHRDLLRFSIKTAAIGREAGRPLNLVLLIDNSGSMERADRVAIIRQCLNVLAGQLKPQDKISVVAFAIRARLVVDGWSGNRAHEVVATVAGLRPQGGTNLEGALDLAYQTALRHYLPDGVNRVVLLTDGAANLGDVDPLSLQAKVEQFRRRGVALDCFGIGWEGYNDELLEVLSRHGDGRYGFVNSPQEAAAEFGDQLAGALQVAASDVKVQVEFNPQRVVSYRQIGYAKHQLTKEQFRDNTVDAAEIGAAESGNALYVVQVSERGFGPLAVVRVRYKVPGTRDYREHEWTVPYEPSVPALDQASPAMRLAAVAAAFSEWLAGSPYAAEVTPDKLLALLRDVPEVFQPDPRPKRLEWMIRRAKAIAGG